MNELVYKNYDADNVEYIRATIGTCLQGLENMLGVHFVISTENYDSNGFKISVSHNIQNASTVDNSVVNKAALKKPQDTPFTYATSLMTEVGKDDWNTLCSGYGFDKDLYGAIVTLRGRAFMLSSFKPRNRKYPLLFTPVYLRNGTYVRLGNDYKGHPSYIKNAMLTQYGEDAAKYFKF